MQEMSPFTSNEQRFSPFISPLYIIATTVLTKKVAYKLSAWIKNFMMQFNE